MQRRNFIKMISYLSCASCLMSGCKKNSSFLSFQNEQYGDLPEGFLRDIENNKFYFKSKKDLPKKIGLEACSLCQLNCPACGVRLLEKDAPKGWLGWLKFKDFKKFVDENNFELIDLSNRGEIFLNPELNKIIKYACKKEIKLTASNGVNLNTVSEKTLENLVKYKFKAITVSIDGATPETYKIYRRGGDFNTVINNIKTINKFKKQYNSEFPKLTWQFILFGHNEHEIELARKKAGELGMEIEFKRNVKSEYSPIKNKKLVEKQAGLKIYEDRIELFQDVLRSKKMITCSSLFDSPQIDYNGNLLGCCKIYYGNMGVNVFKQGLLNALNSPNVIYIKQILTDLSINPSLNIPCAKCSRYRAIKDKNISLPV